MLNNITPEKNNSFIYFFPAYNFSFVIIEIMMGIGLNIEILRKYRINYIYEKIVKGENNLNYNNLSIYIKLLLLFYGKEIKNKKVFQRNIYFFLIQMNQIFSLI